MLQALKMDSSPAPARSRTASTSSSDSPDPTFAGLVAQANAMSQSGRAADDPVPAPEETAPARGDTRSADRAADRAEPTRAAASEARTETPAREKDTKPEDAAAGQAGAASAAAAQSPGTQEAAASAATGTVPAQGVPLVAAGPMTALADARNASEETPSQTEGSQGISAAKALPQDLKQTVETGQGPAKPALTELMYLPKAEVQSPRLSPDGAAKAGESAKPAIVPQAAGTQNQPGVTKDAPDDLTPGTGKPAPKATAPAEVLAALVRTEPQSHEGAAMKAMAPSPDPVQAQSLAAPRPTVASVPAEAAAAAPRANPVFTQVEGSIRWILQNKTQGAELQLHPESLGRVTIQLRVEGQEVHARVWASESSSAAVLQDHKTFLESSLRQQGLTLGSFDLHSGARGDGMPQSPQDRPNVPRIEALAAPEGKQEMPNGIPTGTEDARQIEVYA